MCGLTGVYQQDGSRFSLSYLKKMAKAIAHRGPDDEGYFIEGGIALAHKRLSILDTSSKAAQPMSSHDGRWVIIFNGCIYNFMELKQELRALGHSFISTSDTEVLVGGIAEFGIDFIKQLNGMFAIAAWDTKEECLYLSRDRFGVKPLYYWYSEGSLVFGSEIKAIIQHPDFKVSMNLDALNEYFTFQNLFAYHTLFEGVNMLPPANTIRIDSSTKEIEHQSWWDYDFSQVDESMTFEEAKEETTRLLRQAVARQMVADVPVGSYLSGGMDSGSLTGMASKHVPRLSTFTMGFDMSEVTGVEANYDERREAELMANHFKTEHFEQVINAGDLTWSLPRVVWHLEDLRVGMSYPNYYASRLASKFVKVCLQGTGGDELFGGYPWRYYRVSNSVNQREYFDEYYSFWQRLVSEEDKKILFQPSVYDKIDVDQPRNGFERVFTFKSELKYDTPEQHIQNSLYFECKTFLSGLLLVGDKLSMANGLEERFPFLDNDLVDFAMKVPIRHKLANLAEMKKVDENKTADKREYREHNDGKSVLRKAMGELLPDRIINRKKQGFSAPDESWYRGENADYVKNLLLDPKAAYTEFISPEFVRKIVDEHMSKGANHRLLIWSLMNVEWWCRLFLNGEKIE
jgi:asparagine synthase (glutamine-hydrolysing)